MSTNKIVRVGLIGLGEVTQVVHIPTLGFLSDFFTITYLCDVSQEALQHSSHKVINHVPHVTQSPSELCASTDVDLVFIASSDEYHADHVIEALKHDKHVFVEKPMALCARDADAIITAEQKSQGRVMVGYMRRFATAFVDLVKEVGGIDQILYARVRDIIGPNSHFVAQSGTFPKVFTDFSPEAIEEKRVKAEDIANQALAIECGVPVSPETTKMWRLLCGLGSHDLAAMREALGQPEDVGGAFMSPNFWSAMFRYPGFSVTYESGIDNVPRFDAHLEVYSLHKSVKVSWDTPYVKGLPVTMLIRENVDGSYRETLVRRTYEDPYTLEMKELYDVLVGGKEIKTTAKDAKEDLRTFQLLIKAGQRQHR